MDQELSLVDTINEVVAWSNYRLNARADDLQIGFPMVISARRVWLRQIDGIWVGLYRYDFRGRRLEWLVNMRDLSPLIPYHDQNPAAAKGQGL